MVTVWDPSVIEQANNVI